MICGAMSDNGIVSVDEYIVICMFVSCGGGIVCIICRCIVHGEGAGTGACYCRLEWVGIAVQIRRGLGDRIAKRLWRLALQRGGGDMADLWARLSLLWLPSFESQARLFLLASFAPLSFRP